MSEMRDRVARAISDAARKRHGGTLMAWAVSPERADCEAFADAAIAAMREPTEAMVAPDIQGRACALAMGGGGHEATLRWKAQIDEALR